MPKHKMIAKSCPKCELQMPVACKTCRCGHIFLISKKATRPPSPVDESVRRTQRVRREKPDFYDSLEYDRQVKRAKLRISECEEEEKKDVEKVKRKRVRVEEEEEEDNVPQLTPEQQLMCAVVLDEINRKLQLVTWKPT